MSDDKKGDALVPSIIAAKDTDDALEVLEQVAELLHISDSYNTIRALKDDLNTYRQNFTNIRAKINALGSPYDMAVLQGLRLELSFLFSDLNDSDIVFHVNRLKIQYEQSGKTAKSEAYMSVKSNTELLETLGSKAQKTIEMAAGSTAAYTEWNRCSSSSYGLFCELRAIQEAITLVSHSVSSLINSELAIAKADAH